MQRGADGRVPPRRLVGGTAGDEQLAAPSAQSGRERAAHHRHRQVTEQQQMDQRQQQLLRPGADHLVREAAGEPHLVRRHEPGHAHQRVGCQADVGIGEHHQLVPGSACQQGAGVLLAGPAGGQSGAADQAQPLVADGGEDCGGAVGRAIIKHHELELDAGAGQHRRDGAADVGFLVTCRDQHRDRSRSSGSFGPPEPAQVHQRQREREPGEDEGGHAQDLHHVSPPWLGSKRRPPAVARNQRHES